MRIFLVLLLVSISLSANKKDRFYHAYTKKSYSKACGIGKPIISYYSKNEDFLNAYSFACLYSDNIDLITDAVRHLKRTPESRQNAAFFSTIIAIKKLLYFSLVDDVNIQGLVFPKIDHVLSIVFNKYTKNEYTKKGNTYIFKISSTKKITMRKIKSGRLAKIEIKEYKNNRIIKTHRYW